MPPVIQLVINGRAYVLRGDPHIASLYQWLHRAKVSRHPFSNPTTREAVQ